MNPNDYPADVRKSSMILGIRLSEGLTAHCVTQAWKKNITADIERNNPETSKYLTIAKDTILDWLEGNSGESQPARIPRKPSPDAGSTELESSASMDGEH